jgi:hypothetical protein
MRTRDWRRFQEEKIYRRRIKQFCRNWYYFRTANGDKINDPLWVDFIGLQEFFFYKHGTTKRHDSKYKVKYSPNKTISYYRDHLKRDSLSFGIREKDKVLVRKMIEDELREIETNITK